MVGCGRLKRNSATSLIYKRMSLNHKQPVFDAQIWFTFDGDEDSEVLRVKTIANDRLGILESTGPFSGYRLYFGDEIEVESMGVTEYRLKRVIQPSAYVHYFSVWGIPKESPGTEKKPSLGNMLNETGFTAVLHELGGEWECDMGGLLTVHCPRSRLQVLEERTGWTFSGASEEVSGPIEWNPSGKTKSP